MSFRFAAAASVLIAASFPLPARAEEIDSTPEPLNGQADYSATVVAEKSYSAASSATVRDRDFLLAPRHTPTDLLRSVPGLVLAQHQGGGKADQLFLRGFDCDHGTDVAVSFDGVPVNLVSHAHGQGYADLHFLIPEVIDRLAVTKGPYFADQGDFDTAGAVNIVTRDKLDASSVSVMAGSFDTARLLGLASLANGNLRGLFAGEAYATQGPFVNGENLERLNLFAKAHYDLSERTKVSLLATAYRAGWRGSGQLPARLVDAGMLDRFGAIDPTEGGVTHREQTILALTSHLDELSSVSATVSALRSGMRLFNNFTFQMNDPVHGDAIEQDDDRTMLFGAVHYVRRARASLLPGRFSTRMGMQARHDDIENGLWRVQKRIRLPNCGTATNPCVLASIKETGGALFLEEEWRAARWLRLVAGLRYDLFFFDVRTLRTDGRLEATNETPSPTTAKTSQLSPKANLVISPTRAVDLFLNVGRGFHSNDARSAVQTQANGALAAALGTEAGVRTRLVDDRLELSAALWRLELSSELVWSGDAGGIEPSGSTRREGVDLELRAQPWSWLLADADVMLSRGRFTTGDAIPLSPSLILTGGVTARHPSGLSASLRLRHIGDRPATEQTTARGAPVCRPQMDARDPALSCALIARGYSVLDTQIAYTLDRWTHSLLMENLTNADFREAQFGNDSQVVQGSIAEPHPVRDIHFTPGNPFGIQLAVTARL